MSDTNQKIDVEFYRAKDVQTLLGLSRTAVYYLMNSGAFPVLKMGKIAFVKRSDFDGWVERNTTPAKSA